MWCQNIYFSCELKIFVKVKSCFKSETLKPGYYIAQRTRVTKLNSYSTGLQLIDTPHRLKLSSSVNHSKILIGMGIVYYVYIHMRYPILKLTLLQYYVY